MYVGRFQRNADVKGDDNVIMSNFIFTRIDEGTYNEKLKASYEKYLLENGKDYFMG
jgi:hypothetical protein